MIAYKEALRWRAKECSMIGSNGVRDDGNNGKPKCMAKATDGVEYGSSQWLTVRWEGIGDDE